MRRAGRTAAALLATALLAGCGTASPTLPAQPPPLSIPSIPAPLDGAKFIGDPCTAVTVEQVESIGFTDGGRENGKDGQCVLTFGPIVRVLASWLSPVRETLDSLYRDHATGRDTGNRWEELTINGYPAVLVWVEENIQSHRGDGPLACRLALGLDDRTLMYVGTNIDERAEAGPWQYDACGAAKKIAEFAVENLRT